MDDGLRGPTGRNVMWIASVTRSEPATTPVRPMEEVIAPERKFKWLTAPEENAIRVRIIGHSDTRFN